MDPMSKKTYTLYFKTGRDTKHLETFETLREASARKDEVDEDPSVWLSEILMPHKRNR